ncbi:YqiA/YcfP family alpha/beta fold hydrolase [Psychromonas sp. SR45-3]|uniref:YqiA/YcfP family alpha/beta fold hydrolase n=1 Tax=Psychromonas sp. SR45-3 TaxID=2760930 RepID=UPI0015F921CE|nr:YqiA/YcfP family alpha/beta fold hydrolase [Psychromonas sp. SR45-3]MBB1273685.1 alpha/beta hydrolase [Psychromonas sp. SR45-3]
MTTANITKVLLSLHGFHSSPASLKAQQMRDYLLLEHPEIHFVCPQLPVYPEDMWSVIESVFKQYDKCKIAVMGSSLGGFLATKVAQQYAVKVVLINPAVTPNILLDFYQGEQIHPYLQQPYIINSDYIEQLKALHVEKINYPENIWVLLQQQDEVLDYRDALKKYKQCKITCENGGDHSFIGFERYVAEIIHFLY